MLVVEIDVAVWGGEIDAWRDDTVAHRLDDLNEANYASSGFRVTDVRLRRTEKHRRCHFAPGTENTAKGGGLDWVSEDGAGAVCFDVVD